jgi:hypothetical protein
MDYGDKIMKYTKILIILSLTILTIMILTINANAYVVSNNSTSGYGEFRSASNQFGELNLVGGSGGSSTTEKINGIQIYSTSVNPNINFIDLQWPGGYTANPNTISGKSPTIYLRSGSNIIGSGFLSWRAGSDGVHVIVNIYNIENIVGTNNYIDFVDSSGELYSSSSSYATDFGNLQLTNMRNIVENTYNNRRVQIVSTSHYSIPVQSVGAAYVEYSFSPTFINNYMYNLSSKSFSGTIVDGDIIFTVFREITHSDVTPGVGTHIYNVSYPSRIQIFKNDVQIFDENTYHQNDTQLMFKINDFVNDINYGIKITQQASPNNVFFDNFTVSFSSKDDDSINIYGYVKNNFGGASIGNALVTLYNNENNIVKFGYSGNDGYYLINVKKTELNVVNNFYVTASAPGYYNKTIGKEGLITTDTKSSWYEGNFFLNSQTLNMSTGYFFFRVFDSDRTTLLNNVNITIFNFTDQYYVQNGVTTNGELKIENLNPGDYTINFKYSNYPVAYIYRQKILPNTGTEVILALQKQSLPPTISPNPAPPGTDTNPQPTSVNIGKDIGDSLNLMLTDWGITGTNQGLLIGLFIIVILACIPIMTIQYAPVTALNSHLPEATIIFGLIGFIFNCLFGLFPIWMLIILAVIGVALIGYKIYNTSG